VLRHLAPYLFVVAFPALGVAAVLSGQTLAVFAIYAGVAGAAVLVERFIPFVSGQIPGRWTDVAYFISNAVLLFVIQELAVPGLHAARGYLLGDLTLWAGFLPVVVQVALALVAMEFVHYWAHRISHRDNIFWRSHRIHHSPEGLYWLNGYRFHWVNLLLFSSARIVPMVLLGVPVEVVALVTVIVQTMSLLPHVNADFRSGPMLNLAVNTPELHRWHHLQDPKLSAVNFGATTVVWDHVFRTYQRPGVTPADLLGVPESQRVSGGWVRQVLSPWRSDAVQSAGRNP
jgi:sterol desaturase/sphingolipid hydroxylase (fatty acid hydroxylase superfamily)